MGGVRLSNLLESDWFVVRIERIDLGLYRIDACVQVEAKGKRKSNKIKSGRKKDEQIAAF